MENCCEKHKLSPRSNEGKAKLIARLNRINGQINGIKKMIEDDRYCEDVLIQLAAANKAVGAISAIILEEHMRTCVSEQLSNGNTEVIDEIVGLFKRYR